MRVRICSRNPLPTPSPVPGPTKEMALTRPDATGTTLEQPADLGGAAASNPRTPTGRQYRIEHGDQAATIVEIGAAIREYRVGSRDVLQPFGEYEVSWAYHGCVLVPWPNRVADGRYRFDGVDYQLPITEPERMTALHGLGAWRPWQLVDHRADAVTLRLALFPSPGYPFHLDVVVEYRLSSAGLGVRVTTTNTGDRACPYGVGFHPYVALGDKAVDVAVGDSTLDDCRLRIPAARWLPTDDRLIPLGDDPVDGTPFDFRTPHSLAGVSLDTAFAGAVRDADGRSRAYVDCPDGHRVEVWADETVDYWQVYTADRLPEPLARRSVAVEPMTAAPNAFRSGAGLRRLEPADVATTVWGAVLH